MSEFGISNFQKRPVWNVGLVSPLARLAGLNERCGLIPRSLRSHGASRLTACFAGSLNLDVKITNVESVIFNKPAPRFDLVAHQDREYLISFDNIIDLYLQQRSSLRVHCCIPELFGVHLTQSFVALDMEVLLRQREN